MKYGAFVLVLMFLMASPALADNCSCTAPDRSCSAQISCPEGCSAICGSGGYCKAYCAGAGPGGGPRHDDPAPLVSPGAASPDLVSLHAVDLTSHDLAVLVGDALKADVQFVPVDPLQTYSIHVIDFPPGELAQALAHFGAVAVAGETTGDFLKVGAVPEAEVTIRIEDTTMSVVVGLLDQLVAENGVTIRVTDPFQAFSLDVQRMPLEELLIVLESMGAIKLEYGTR